MLMQLSKGGMEERNLEFAPPRCRTSVNEWQLETFVKPEAAAPRGHRGAAGGCSLRNPRDRTPRHRSVVCPDHHLAAVERSARATGANWPIFEAARNAATGQSRCTSRVSAAATPRPRRAGRPTTWRSTTLRPRVCRTRDEHGVRAGVFERFPKLKIVLVEGGFAWAPGVVLAEMGQDTGTACGLETPHVKRPPSEYVREHVWFTTQARSKNPTPAASRRGHRMARLGPADVSRPTTRTGTSTIRSTPSSSR